jgi:hypothetical protein
VCSSDLVFTFLAYGSLSAQEKAEKVEEVEVVTEAGGGSGGARWESQDFPVLERGIDVLTPKTLRAKSLLFLVEHRARNALKDNAFQDFLGLDAGGLKVGLGLRYGFTDWLEGGFYRLNGQTEIFDTYEFDLKCRLLEESVHGVALAVRGGGTWFAQSKMKDASGGFAQLLVGKYVNPHLRIGTGLLYHSESSGETKSTADDAFSVAIPVQLEIRFNRRFAWDIEGAANVAGYGAAHPIIATSLKIITWRHTFSIIFGNNRYTSSDGIVANSPRSLNEAVIGFLITREFNF